MVWVVLRGVVSRIVDLQAIVEVLDERCALRSRWESLSETTVYAPCLAFVDVVLVKVEILMITAEVMVFFLVVATADRQVDGLGCADVDVTCHVDVPV